MSTLLNTSQIFTTAQKALSGRPQAYKSSNYSSPAGVWKEFRVLSDDLHNEHIEYMCMLMLV